MVPITESNSHAEIHVEPKRRVGVPKPIVKCWEIMCCPIVVCDTLVNNCGYVRMFRPNHLINGMVRVFWFWLWFWFWPAGVMKKLPKGSTSERVWGLLLDTVKVATTQWLLAFSKGQYIEILICASYLLYFFLLCHSLSKGVSRTWCFIPLGKLHSRAESFYAEDFPAWLWRSNLIMPAFSERRERCVLWGNKVWGGLPQS